MQATVQQGNWQKQWGMLVANAWSDDELRQRLLTEPAAVLEEYGIECYQSQFVIGRPTEPPTFIDRWRDQAAYWGGTIGVNYGEPFASREPLGLETMLSIK